MTGVMMVTGDRQAISGGVDVVQSVASTVTMAPPVTGDRQSISGGVDVVRSVATTASLTEAGRRWL